MPVSGIVLTCGPRSVDGVALRIAAIEGVEVHGVLPDGRIVAVVVADTVDDEVAVVSKLQEIEGVDSVQLAYHHFEAVDEAE